MDSTTLSAIRDACTRAAGEGVIFYGPLAKYNQGSGVGGYPATIAQLWFRCSVVREGVELTVEGKTGPCRDILNSQGFTRTSVGCWKKTFPAQTEEQFGDALLRAIEEALGLKAALTILCQK